RGARPSAPWAHAHRAAGNRPACRDPAHRAELFLPAQVGMAWARPGKTTEFSPPGEDLLTVAFRRGHGSRADGESRNRVRQPPPRGAERVLVRQQLPLDPADDHPAAVPDRPRRASKRPPEHRHRGRAGRWRLPGHDGPATGRRLVRPLPQPLRAEAADHGHRDRPHLPRADRADVCRQLSGRARRIRDRPVLLQRRRSRLRRDHPRRRPGEGGRQGERISRHHDPAGDRRRARGHLPHGPRHGAEAFTSNWLLVVVVTAIPFGFFGGMLSDRIKRRKIFVYAAGAAQAFVAIVFIALYPTVIPLVFGLGIAYGVGYGLYFAV